jgi:ABC-type multidrug transport system fused ATPase/permease subunit
MVTKRKLLTDFFRRNPVLLSLTFFSGLLNSITSVLIPVFVGKYYQLALHSGSPRGKLFDKLFVHLRDIDVLFLLFGGLILAKVLFTFFEKYLSGYSSEVFSKTLREDLIRAQMAFTMSAFEKKLPGKYLLRYSGDLSAIQRYVMNGIIKFSIDIIFLVFAFAVLSLLNFKLTLIIFISFPLFFLAIFYLNKYLQCLTIKRRNARSELLAFVSSRLHSLLTVKIFNREGIEQEKFEKGSEKLFRYGKKYFRLYGFISSLFPLFLYALLLAMLIYMHYLRVNYKAEFHAHELLIFIMMVISVLPVFRRTLRVNLVWQAGNVSISKILRIFNNEIEVKDKSDEVKFDSGQIEIRNLDFAYPNGEAVFKNFSCTVPDGKITWLSGIPGSGKTTLFKIITGLYQPLGGEIIIDAKNVQTLSRHTVRKNITMVSDELPLLGKTIFEAISYSRKEEKREKAKEMLEKLKFTLAGEREINLDHRVFDGGKNLSAGQRKLLHIARALLTRKKIILMDEPFQGLDEAAKNNLVKLLGKLKEKRTIFIITSENITGFYDHVIELKPIHKNITEIID